MAITLEYDDSNLQRLFAELDPKQRMKAMKGAFRSEANRVRKVAVKNLRSSVNSSRELEKGIRRVVFKKKLGFQITIKPKYTRAERKEAKEDTWFGFRLGKKKRKVPVLIFLENGTKERYARDTLRRMNRGMTYRQARSGKKRYTGKLKAYHFMEKTKNEVGDSVTENLRNALREHVQKVAKKYGCK